MSGIYRTLRDQILSIWTANWTHTTVPVLWRENDPEPLPDPQTSPHFLRNEIVFGRERIRAFGGGQFSNERFKYGSVIVRVFASRALQTDDTQLDLLSDAEAVFRSQRVGELTFIGDVSGYDEDASVQPPEENGNWFMRGSLIVFEYRFVA